MTMARRRIHMYTNAALFGMGILSIALGLFVSRSPDFAMLSIVPLGIAYWLLRSSRFALKRMPMKTHEHHLLICERCGYDLRGSLESRRCPECGQRFGTTCRTSRFQSRRRIALGHCVGTVESYCAVSLVLVFVAFQVALKLKWNLIPRTLIVVGSSTVLIAMVVCVRKFRAIVQGPKRGSPT